MFDLFRFLHVLTMFAAVTLGLGAELILHGVARSGNVQGIRTFASVIGPFARLTPFVFLLGLVFGLLAAWFGSLDFFRPWLIASYVVFALAMAVGGIASGPWAARVAQAAFASPDDAPSAELRAAIHDRRGVVSSVVLISAIAVLVFLMVVKPGG